MGDFPTELFAKFFGEETEEDSGPCMCFTQSVTHVHAMAVLPAQAVCEEDCLYWHTQWLPPPAWATASWSMLYAYCM